ncbi:MAG: leucyl aminopeptidase [Solirubrobacterales bacterium]|nr:leucyl aminopeptidase [Solirubrobacterales bacterium]
MSTAVDVAATTEPPFAADAEAVAIGLFEGDDTEGVLPELTALVRSGEARGSFRHLAGTHVDGRRTIVVGLGARADFDGERARIAAALVGRRAAETGARRLCWALPDGAGAETVDGIVGGTVLGAYRFTRFRSGDGEPPLSALTISGPQDVGVAVARAATLAHAQNRARDLGNRPPNDLTPTALADYARAAAADSSSLTVTVLDEEQINAAGMGAFAAVARGSAEPARLIVLDYAGPGALHDGSRLALVGKAVTFDSGGLSLKAAASQVGMKFDMAGGAAVIEALAALAALAAPVRVLGLVGATENLPSDRSVRPGDIVTALDGTTIEIDNTDAEGRLVLADCITYAQQLGCASIVDIATLTGGVISALGRVHAGLMANDDALAERAIDCGRRTGELLWRLPLHPAYAEMTKGRDAQLTNRPMPREALAVTAAELLHHFAGDVPWAHLDIAGVGDGGLGGRAPYLDKGATGFGVRLLVELALAGSV